VGVVIVTDGLRFPTTMGTVADAVFVPSLTVSLAV